MTKKQKKVLIRIIIAALLTAVFCFLPAENPYVRLVLFLIPYLVIGYDILRKAVLGILHGEVFDENFLMAVATVGAIALGEYVEGTAVMLFYQIGELFQSYAVGRSRRNITALMDIRPDYANIEQDGVLVQVDPEEVEPGTIITVQPGEKVPIDGVIVEGASTLNTSALTGESLPREAAEGDEVISGCVNMSGVLHIRTTKAFGEYPGSGGELQHEEIPIREFYHQICQILYAGRLSGGPGAGGRAAACQPADRTACRMVTVGHPGAHNAGHQLSLCAGDLDSSKFLRRDRRRFGQRHTGQRLQLSGGIVKDHLSCVR